MTHVPDKKGIMKFMISNQSDLSKASLLKHIYQSHQINRSPNSATILLLGFSGAGKSATINSFFGTEILKVGEDQTNSSHLIEMSAHFPSEFLGISNSQIHIIDTPGLNNSQHGMEFDHCVMTQISQYFKNKNYLPNVVLLALKYTENRIDGEFSDFVKTLQTIRRHLIGRVLDLDHPNLLVVLTHLCAATPKESKNPQSKIQVVKKLISEHIGISECSVVVVENHPEEWDLKKIEPHYYQLPNGELFPKNMLQAIIELTKEDDPVGCYLIQDAYRNLYKLNAKFEEKIHEIDPKNELLLADKEYKSIDVKHKDLPTTVVEKKEDYSNVTTPSESHSQEPPLSKQVMSFHQPNRSPNSATILLLGFSGAGKSATINSFFGTQITKVGEDQTYTSHLIEISLKSHSNSQIHIINSPGFNDNERGSGYDISVMNRVSQFFLNKHYLPNVILLTVNYTDKRLQGECSQFIKLLQSIELHLMGTVIDRNHSNFIVVLTHLCAAIPKESKNPHSKIQLVKQLISAHLGIPDCPVVVAENCPEDWDLKKIGARDYELPNGETFPDNIYRTIEKLTEKDDPLACQIIQDAYKNIQQSNIEMNTMMHDIISKRDAISDVDENVHENVPMEPMTDTELSGELREETSLVYVPDKEEFGNLLNGDTNGCETIPNWKHVYQSYISKRSTNSVTILLIGITGAGKSSIINSLFGTNISEVDERKSCTSQLIEISAHFPSTFLGMSNSQIHVIDTPGFNDTERGVEFDANVIANISDFFKSKDYFPNIVLLVLNISDVRIDGGFSPFVKTLKIIRQQLVETVIDKEHPNLVIVLTHLCSLGKRTNPSQKISFIKRLIAEHLGVTNSPVVVAESRPNEWKLKKTGPDYSELPNGDLFPRNIFGAMKELTKNVDGVGYYLIQDAYRNLPKLKTQFKKTSHQIVRKANEDIMRNEIMDMSGDKRSELHEQINAAWKLLPDQKRKSLSPSQISQTLKNLGYDHLPKTQTEMITFFRHFSYDNDIRIFLQNTFGLRPPRFDIDLKVGNGYDITKDALISTSKIVSIGKDVYHKLGCFLGEHIESYNNPEIQFFCEIFQSSKECERGRLRQLGIDISKPEVAVLDYQYRNGYNIYQGNFTQKLTAVYERRLMKLSFKKLLASDEIIRSLNELPTRFDRKDSSNVNKWTKFFRNYGTHYVSSAYIGGNVTFKISGVTSTQMKQLMSCHQGGITGFVKLFMGSANCQQNCRITMTVSGGNQKEGMYLAQSKNHEEFESRLKLWEETILDNPMVSDLSITLGDIADVVHNVRPDLFNAMKQAIGDLYGVRMSHENQPANNENPSRENDTAPPSDGSGCLTTDALISTSSGSVPSQNKLKKIRNLFGFF